MDEFADQFFSSSSWIEDNTPDQGSYWVGGGQNQTNGVVDSAIEASEGYGKNLPTNLVASSDIVDSFITDDASMFVGGDSGYGFDNNIITTESQPLIDHGSSNSLLGLVDANLLPNYGNQQPELFHVDIDPISSPSVQPESGSVGSNESESSVVQHTLSDPPAFPTLPPVWDPSSYGGVSSLCNVIEQNRQQGIELLEQYVDANAIGNSSFMDGDILQDSLPTLFPDQHELNNQHVSSFSVEHQIPLGISADIQPQMQLTEGNSSKYYRDQSPVPQLPQAPVTSVGGCNGVVKPRVRARRGQATDPHSIAERLRREKIAERMKSLQELVPNSNKTDKASMLDEMIDYVKLLQLQVKALSMSKLGAAEVANPLIPHGHAKGSSGLFLPQPAGRGVDPFDSSNGMGALEQEVVKLMESDMAAAKQFLDTKGLSLMPLALASAISSTKASLCSTSGEETKSIMANGGVHHKLSSDGGTRSKGNKTGINSSRERVPNHCNGKNIKREEIFNTEKA